MEGWVQEADLDGFSIAYVTTPGTFEDVVQLLVPELRRRGIYPERRSSGGDALRYTGKGQARLRDDHVGSTFNYKCVDEKLDLILSLASSHFKQVESSVSSPVRKFI